MPGNLCSVAICRRNGTKCKEKGEKVRFFTFPKDPNLRKKWVELCYRKDNNWNPQYRRICSKHFTLSDYEDGLQAKLLKIVPKKLKTNAVPSLLLRPGDPDPPPDTDDELIEPIEKEIEIEIGRVEMPADPLFIAVDTESSSSQPSAKKPKMTPQKEVPKSESVEAIQKKYDTLMKKYDRVCVQLCLEKKRNARLQERLDKRDYDLARKVEGILSKFLSDQQVNIIMRRYREHSEKK